MNNEHHCYATGMEELPSSVYIKDSLHICRGTPSEIIVQLVPSNSTLTVQESLLALVNQLSSTRNLHVELPRDVPDDILSNLFLQVLLDLGVIGSTPLS